MDDYLMPTEEQIKLMADEYAKINMTKPPIAQKNFSFPFPIYLTKYAESIIILHNEMLSNIESIQRQNIGKNSNEILDTIKQIITKNSIHIAKICKTNNNRQDTKVSSKTVKQNLLEMLDSQAKCLSNLYLLRSHISNNLFDTAISDELISASLLHNLCL